MSDWVEEVGRATGHQTAELISNQQDNDFRIEITKKPKVGDKGFPSDNLGAHVFQTRRRPVNEALAENGSSEPSTRRSSLSDLGAVYGERVVVPADESPFVITDVAPPVEHDPYAKGLDDAGAVDQINNEVQLAQAEATIPAASGAAGSAAGSGLLSKFLVGVGSFLSIPLTTVAMLLYRIESTADGTLDGLPPELQVQLQQRLERAQLEGDTLGGSLVITRSAEGSLEVTDSHTGQTVIGADGQVLNREALSGLLQVAYSQASFGDPVPGLGLPSEIIAIDPFAGLNAFAFQRAREHNAQADLGDQQLVLDLVFPDGTSRRAMVHGGLPQLMVEALLAERQGLLPEGTVT